MPDSTYDLLIRDTVRLRTQVVQLQNELDQALTLVRDRTSERDNARLDSKLARAEIAQARKQLLDLRAFLRRSQVRGSA